MTQQPLYYHISLYNDILIVQSHMHYIMMIMLYYNDMIDGQKRGRRIQPAREETTPGPLCKRCGYRGHVLAYQWSKSRSVVLLKYLSRILNIHVLTGNIQKIKTAREKLKKLEESSEEEEDDQDEDEDEESSDKEEVMS